MSRTKKILDIYQQYNLMPNLVEHQLRVAAVAQIVGDNFQDDINTHDVVTAMLLHDMGNIIKFDLSKFPQFCEPHGIEYWESIRQEMIQKYGSSEHQAHLAIARELGIPEHIVHLIDAVGFSHMKDNVLSEDYERKICAYADTRVGPFGVLSLHDRLEDGRKRYNITASEERWDLVEAASKLEQQIFENCSIEPHDITDEMIAPIIETLKSKEISVDL